MRVFDLVLGRESVEFYDLHQRLREKPEPQTAAAWSAVGGRLW